MSYNKFTTQGGRILLDLTNSTVESAKLEKGITAYNKHGNLITGTLEHLLQEKEVNPSTQDQVISATEGNYGLSKVKVNAIQTEERLTDTNGEVIPADGKYLTKVTVNVQPALQSKNIAPSRETQIIQPDSQYYGLSSVSIAPIPEDCIIPQLETKQVTPSNATQVIKPSDNFDALSEVTVEPIPTEYIIPNGTLNITENGIHNVTSYASTNVNVQPSLQTKTATPTKASQSISADSNYYGLKTVTVNPIPNTFMEVPSDTLAISSNGTHSVLNYASATVNVQPALQSKEVTPTTTEQTVTADTDKYGLSSVKVKAISTEEKTTTANGNVIPTEGKYLSKVTVNVQPSLQSKEATPTKASQNVVADTGYYGLGKVTVNPIPDNYIIPTGTTNITSNGTHTVTSYATATVNVQPSLQEKTVTTNGTVTPDSGYYGLSKVTVNTPEFNIAYGTTAPTDTSKLWVKMNKPSTVEVITNPAKETTDLTYGVAILPMELAYTDAVLMTTRIYLFGGYCSRGNNTSIRNLDITTNSFVTITSISGLSSNSTLQKMGASAVGSKVYFFGAYSGSTGTGIYVYDTSAKTFSTLSTTLPEAIASVTAVVKGTKIYLFGGETDSSSYSSAIRVFNTADNTLTTLSTTLTSAMGHMAGACVGDKIYLFGGITTSGRVTTVQVFDTTNNIITTVAALPMILDDIGCAAVNKKIYLFGGTTSDSASSYPTSYINVFDTETQTMSTLATRLPRSLTGISCVTSGSTIYLFGGVDSNNAYTNAVGTFKITTSSISARTNTLLIEAGNSKNTFTLLPGINLSVNGVYFDDANGTRTKVSAALYKNGAWTEI
jgi:N-acetylneuraminic acid mutarotase